MSSAKICQFSLAFVLKVIYLHAVYFKLHHEAECPEYPVVCEKCNRDSIPRAKVKLCTFSQFHFPFLLTEELNFAWPHDK